MRKWIVAGSGALLAVFLGCLRLAHGGSLSDSLLQTNPGDVILAAPFVVELQRTIARGTDFPATATTPGFTYRYDPELNIYERSSTSLGPAFLERADTVGKGRYDLGVSYLLADFDELDGDDLEGLERGLLVETAGGLDAANVTFDRFNLKTNAIYFSGTYGITDRFDVNALIPVFYTTLKTDQDRVTTAAGTDRFKTDDDALGVGDLQLRAKYLLKESGPLKGAAGLSLRIPTGEEDDFQGVGDVTVTPSAVLSRPFGPHDVHLSFGMEVDADDLERTQGKYGVGISLGLEEYFTVNADVIGTSQLFDEELSSFVAGRDVFEVRGAAGDVFSSEDVKFKAAAGGTKVVTTLSRRDVVDLAVGVKVSPFGNAVLFASAIVPLTEDGARALVIPAVGVEVSF